MTGATGHRAALAAALGSAVLDVLAERGIVANPNLTGHPFAGAATAVPQLELRRSRWVATPETYLGAAAADPVTVLGRIVGTPGKHPGRRGNAPGPGSIMADAASSDPAPFAPSHGPRPGASDYPQGDVSPDDDGRGR